jgi:nicotinamidase-related amidase
MSRLFSLFRPSQSGKTSNVFRLNARRENATSLILWVPRQTALIICDMWDDHWCKRAAQRCSELAPLVNNFAQRARARGALIVHAPSDTMSFYGGMPQRKRARKARVVTPPVPIETRMTDPTREPELPIVDSDGGCDDEPPSAPRRPFPWKRQHPAIAIARQDVISDDGKEIYNVLMEKGIKNVFLTGVHTNKCVLARPFGIRQMVMLGMNVLLVRDLTDSLYNPSMPPWVGHEQGTQLVVEHIEKYWCPSIRAQDLESP